MECGDRVYLKYVRIVVVVGSGFDVGLCFGMFLDIVILDIVVGGLFFVNL